MKCTRIYFPETKMTHTEVKSLDVILHYKQRVGYCSGEVVSGHVSLKLSEATSQNLKRITEGICSGGLDA